MKFAAATLACVVLITSMYPVPKEYLSGFQTQSKSQHQCCMKQHMQCSKESEKEKKNSKSGCANNSCSPFSACNYYPVIPAFSYKVVSPKLIFSGIKFVSFKADIFSNYYADIWHPPRTI